VRAGRSRRRWAAALIVAVVVGVAAAVSARTSPHAAPPSSRTFSYPLPAFTSFVDSSAELLRGDPHGAVVARTAPTVDLGVLHIDPRRYGPDYGAWGNVVRGPDGRYYFGLGDHAASDHGGHDGALLVSYDPAARRARILLFSKDLFGPNGEGKFHGRPDIDPRTGDMYLIGFYQGHVVRYNIYSRRATDLGAPVPGSGWQEHTWDWQRSRLFGVGDGSGGVLVYDTRTGTVLHRGIPVDSVTGRPFRWSPRARLLDRSTGNLYGTDADDHLTMYDAGSGRFSVLHSTLRSPLRAWSERRDADGAFWLFDVSGNVYRFHPDRDSVEERGVDWGPNGWYVTSLATTADGRYLYYSLAADRSSPTSQGQPVLQYDTRTSRVTVIAFLAGDGSATPEYQTTKVYGVALRHDGGSLILVANGNAAGEGRMPAVFDVRIPASER
jgi:hypothetical protein